MDIVLSWDGIGCVSSVDARCSPLRDTIGNKRTKLIKKKKNTENESNHICTIFSYYNKIS